MGWGGGGHTFRTRFSTSHTSMGYRVEDMDFMTDTEEIKDMDLRTGTDRKETLGFTSTETIQAYRDGEVGGSGIFISNTYSLHCHHQNDSA